MGTLTNKTIGAIKKHLDGWVLRRRRLAQAMFFEEKKGPFGWLAHASSGTLGMR
jgi:hypothetical protein